MTAVRARPRRRLVSFSVWAGTRRAPTATNVRRGTLIEVARTTRGRWSPAGSPASGATGL